jgi:hypothetical protein
MALADFIKVQKFLGGIHYPATKQQLVDHARGNQADDEALSALSGMPEREYTGPDEVSRAIPDGLSWPRGAVYPFSDGPICDTSAW